MSRSSRPLLSHEKLLLVLPEQYEAAGEVAEACGFHCGFQEKDLYCIHQPYGLTCPEDILTETLPLEFDPGISRESVANCRHRVLIEIHRGIFHDVNGIANNSRVGALWEGVQTAHFPDGTPFYYPAPEAMLFHLAAHAADHQFGRLMFFMDIAATARHWSNVIDWNRMVRLSNEYEVSSHIYRSLELAQRAFGAPVPSEVLDRMAAAQGRRAARLKLALPDVMASPFQDRKARFLQRLLLSPDRRQLCASLFSTITPPPLMMRLFMGYVIPC